MNKSVWLKRIGIMSFFGWFVFFYSAQSQQLWPEVFFSSDPTPNFYNWDHETDLLNLSIYAEIELPVKIKALGELQDASGTILASSNSAFTPVLSINPGETNFSGNELFSFSSFQIDASLQKILDRTKRLPEGNYQFCIRIVDASNNQLLTEFPTCSYFYIQNPTAPILVAPTNGTQVTQDEVTNMVFQWIPETKSDMSEGSFQQNLIMTEVLPGQSPEQAIRINRPILDECFWPELTDFVWMEDMISLPLGMYVWSVRLVDVCGGTVIADFGHSFILVVSDDGEDQDTVSIPPEYPPIIETDTKGCSNPSFVPKKGSDVSLGMILEKPEIFLYPRAVGLRAEGIDIDLVQFHCSGCDGNLSTRSYIVRDEVGEFKWKLKGKGSLNSPANLDAILKLQESIHKLEEQIKAEEDTLAHLQTEVDSTLPQQTGKLEKRVEETKRQLAEAESKLAVEQDNNTQLGDDLQETEDQISQANDSIALIAGKLDENKKKIDELNEKLVGKPSPDELLSMNEINRLRGDQDREKETLTQKDEEIINTSDQLSRSVVQARENLEGAVERYNSANAVSEEISLQIRQLETQLMSDTRYRDLMQWENELRSKTLEFVRLFVGISRQGEFTSRLKEFISQAEESLGNNELTNRNMAKVTLRVLLNGFVRDLSQNCINTSSETRSNCRIAVNELNSTSEDFSSKIRELIESDYQLKLSTKRSIDTLRQNLDGLQGGLANLSRQVSRANELYEQAVTDMGNELIRLDNARTQILSNLASLEDQRILEEGKLKELISQREKDLENNRQSYLDQIFEARNQIISDQASHEQLISELTESLAKKQQLTFEKETSDATIQKLKDQIDQLNQVITLTEQSKEQVKKKIEARKKEIDTKKGIIDDLKSDLVKLEEELKKLLENQQSKEAVGPLIYYIPPPLEELMNATQEDRFEELKEQVREAEKEVSKAYGDKGDRQAKLVKMTNNVARELVKYKTASEEIDKLKEEISSLEEEIDQEITTKAAEYLDEQNEVNTRITELTTKKGSIEAKANDLKTQTNQIRDGINSITKDIDEAETLREKTENDVIDLQNDYNQAEASAKTAERELNLAGDNLEKEKIRLKGLKKDLALAENDLTRAHAANNTDAIVSIQSRISELSASITTSESLIQTQLDPAVADASARYRTEAGKAADINENLMTARQEWQQICRYIDYDLRDQLEKKNNELENNLSDITQTQKKQKETEEALSKSEERKEWLKTAADQDEGIKEKKSSKEAMDKEVEQQTEAQTKAANAVKSTLEEKDRLIRSTDDALKQAKKKLEKNNKELRDFLFNLFEHVDFKVNIELTAKDLVIDKFRAKDTDPNPLIKTLEFPKSRQPRLVGGDTRAQELTPEIETHPSVCNPEWGFDPDPPIRKQDMNLIDLKEPRTIALIYRSGEPLWPEWPVIPPKAPLLAKDIVRVQASFSQDQDQIKYECVTDADCKTQNPLTATIKDINRYRWSVAGRVITTHPLINQIFWETAMVNPDRKTDMQKLESFCEAREVAEDIMEKLRKDPEVTAGYMIEVTDKLVGVPDTSLTVTSRIVTGDHLGLSEETIRFEAVLKDGESEGWGFAGGKPTIDVTTDQLGYGKTKFAFGNGFASFDFTVTWIRGGQEVQTEKFEGISPLKLGFHRFSTTAPDFAWKAAEKLMEKGGSAAEGVADFPSIKDEENEGAYDPAIHAVAGLLDAEKDFVNEQKILFEVEEDEITIDPEEDKTHLFGTGVTWIELPGNESDEEKEIEIHMKAKVEEKFEKVADPAEEKKAFSTAKENTFKIGSPDLPFVVIMDDGFTPSETISGSGRLGIQDDLGCDLLLQYIYEVPLEVDGVELAPADEGFLAINGKVTYKAATPVQKSLGNFNFFFESFSVTANTGAGLTGKITHSTYFPDSIGFTAVLEPNGNFMGTLSELPEVEIKSFKLKKGASVTLDFHNGDSPGGLPDGFRGIFIHQGNLILPESFSSTEGERPELTAEKLYIGNKGDGSESSWLFGGKIGYEGTLIKLGYAGYELTANEVNVEFSNGELKSCEINGELKLPDPMEGKIGVTVSASGDGFSAKVKTDYPITIPRLGMTMTLQNNCGVEWVANENLGKLTLNAYVVSQKFGAFDIKGFEMNSKGEIKTDKIAMSQEIKFASGFNLKIDSIGFAVTQDEYNFKANGSFGFPGIGIENMSGSVTLKPGPSIEVTFQEAKINFEKGPVDFSGEFAYSGSEFRGEFDISIKKILENGIKGLLIVGNTPDVNEAIYNYWYAQLEIGTSIPLGQTGLSILSLGGGVGYNYNPPIGAESGSPANTGSLSLKAIMSMGNYPKGELFAGRMEMVYTPGKFSLYGKTWLFTMEDALYGEGQLNLYWQPKAKVDGYVGMYIRLPNSEGDMLKMEGKIKFLYAGGNDFYIKSETLTGTLLNSVNAEAVLDITSNKIHFDGDIRYDLNSSYDLSIVKAIVDVNIHAGMNVDYQINPMIFHFDSKLSAYWNFDLDTPLGKADITSGDYKIGLELDANEQTGKLRAYMDITYDVWVYEGSTTIEFPYTIY